MTTIEDFLSCLKRKLQAGVIITLVGVVSLNELQGNYVYVQFHELVTFVRLFSAQVIWASDVDRIKDNRSMIVNKYSKYMCFILGL